MKKFLSLLGAISIMSSSSLVVSCTEENFQLSLVEPLEDVIDTFDKRDVEDFFFGYSIDDWTAVTEVFIKFKKQENVKEYGQLKGNLVYWLRQISVGLNMLPNQEKYEGYNKWVEPIPKWAWIGAYLWDFDKNEPKLPKK